jgi:hypothetical protein
MPPSPCRPASHSTKRKRKDGTPVKVGEAEGEGEYSNITVIICFETAVQFCASRIADKNVENRTIL